MIVHSCQLQRVHTPLTWTTVLHEVNGDWAAASRRSELRVWLVQGNWLDLLSPLVLHPTSLSIAPTSWFHNHSIVLDEGNYDRLDIMTDPLSITAACVGLLAGIQSLSTTLTKFIGKAQGARVDVEGFHRELQSLLPCVEALRDESFPFPEASRAQLISLLEDCEDVIEDMKAIIKKHRQSRHSRVRSVQWSMADGDEVERLRRRLESFKSTCNITLAMAKCITDHGSFTEIKETLESLKSQVAALHRGKDSARNPLLQRYLDETISYAESIVDSSDAPFVGDDPTPAPEDNPAPAAVHTPSPSAQVPRSPIPGPTVLDSSKRCNECNKRYTHRAKKISSALPCGHRICNRCLRNKFEASMTDRALMPPRCCTDQHIDLKHVDALLSVDFKKRWNRKFREFKTEDPLYCNNPACGEWISPNYIQAVKNMKFGRCRFCKTQVVRFT
jgi:hypothetical protein